MFTMRTTDQNVLLKVQLRIEKPLGQLIPPHHRLLRSRLVRKKKYFRLVTIVLIFRQWKQLDGNSVPTICIIVLFSQEKEAELRRMQQMLAQMQAQMQQQQPQQHCASSLTAIFCCHLNQKEFFSTVLTVYSALIAVSTPLALTPSNVKILGFLDKIPFKCQHLTNSLCFIFWSLHQ